MNFNSFNDVKERIPNRFSECPLAKKTSIFDVLDKVEYKFDVVQNKLDGIAREEQVGSELREKYPPEKGYEVIRESVLRDKDGNIAKDPLTGQGRRIDFVVVKDGKVIEMVEVTSKTAPKDAQIAKENRIRQCGGNYIKDGNGNLIQIPNNVQTRIDRRD